MASCTAQLCISLELCQIKYQDFTDVHRKSAQSKDEEQKQSKDEEQKVKVDTPLTAGFQN